MPLHLTSVLYLIVSSMQIQETYLTGFSHYYKLPQHALLEFSQENTIKFGVTQGSLFLPQTVLSLQTKAHPQTFYRKISSTHNLNLSLNQHCLRFWKHSNGDMTLLSFKKHKDPITSQSRTTQELEFSVSRNVLSHNLCRFSLTILDS